jgi:hypothetical protein
MSKRPNAVTQAAIAASTSARRVTSQRIAGRLDMKKVVKLLWPVE